MIVFTQVFEKRSPGEPDLTIRKCRALLLLLDEKEDSLLGWEVLPHPHESLNPPPVIERCLKDLQCDKVPSCNSAV